MKKRSKKKKDMSFVQFEQEMQGDSFSLKYEYAVTEIEKFLSLMRQESCRGEEHKKIEYITSRIKTPESAAEKLKRKGKELSIKSAEKYLNDIAGICVVCPYYEDVYEVAGRLAGLKQIEVVKQKDFIRYPKASGYRSLHLILGIHNDLIPEGKRVNVEIQIRTVTMDAWARLDHELHYKKKYAGIESICRDLRKCSDAIADVDDTMQRIRTQMRQVGTQ